MNHQPFEERILDGATLSAADRRALNEHIESCATCNKLQTKWWSVRREMRVSAQIAPAPGFIARWETGLIERKANEARKQAWKAFFLFGSLALILMLGLVGYVLSVSSPADWLNVIVRYSAQSGEVIEWLISGAQYWLRISPPALNIAIWIYAAAMLCLLSLAWVFALWRTSIVGVFNQ